MFPAISKVGMLLSKLMDSTFQLFFNGSLIEFGVSILCYCPRFAICAIAIILISRLIFVLIEQFVVIVLLSRRQSTMKVLTLTIELVKLTSWVFCLKVLYVLKENATAAVIVCWLIGIPSVLATTNEIDGQNPLLTWDLIIGLISAGSGSLLVGVRFEDYCT